MFPYILQFGPVSISTFGFLSAVAFIMSSFLLWKMLKEEYPEEEIITFTIQLFLNSLLFSRLAFILINFDKFGFDFIKWVLWGKYSGFSSIGGIVGGAIILYLWSKRRKWDFWMLSDAIVFTFLIVQIFVCLGMFLSTALSIYLAKAIISLILIVISYLMLKNYRKIVWYKSGKMGFTACFVFSVFLFSSGLLEIFSRQGIYLESIAFFLFSILPLFFLYKRSERRIREDILNLLRIKSK